MKGVFPPERNAGKEQDTNEDARQNVSGLTPHTKLNVYIMQDLQRKINKRKAYENHRLP